ncbi:MAG: ribonuclease HII [Bacteroidota bacterium]
MLLSCYTDDLIEAGCDEAGRGCLAGPVYAAAVIFPKDYKNELLNDSKKLSEKHRLVLRKVIETDALAYAVVSIDNIEIDKINILNASIKGMQDAVALLKITPQFLLIDGNRFKPYRDIPYKCIIEGDAKYLSIAAASILAKTYRDECMEKLHEEYPAYNWNKNKAYATLEHREMIKKIGITPYHRLSYKPCQLLLLDL